MTAATAAQTMPTNPGDTFVTVPKGHAIDIDTFYRGVHLIMKSHGGAGISLRDRRMHVRLLFGSLTIEQLLAGTHAMSDSHLLSQRGSAQHGATARNKQNSSGQVVSAIVKRSQE